MKQTIKYLAILALVISTRAAFGQTGFSETVTTYTAGNSPIGGNDFWFAPIQNNIDTVGKYIRVYVSSLVSTTAYIQYGSFTESAHVPAGGDTVFNIPLAFEIKSSGVVENKGIHVWSSNANLSVYLMSHIPYSGDGFYCLQTPSLGTDYVVAAYEALFDGFGSVTGDYPSECTITATRDNTTVEITPTADCRQSLVYPQAATVIGAYEGKLTSVTLNRGQSIQFQTVQATDADNYDLTGTIIHSNYPVAVVSGSMMPNIPPDFPYPDYICDMMLPVQSWGETYYTTNSIQPTGEQNKDFNLYLMVSSVPNQTIYRYSPTQGVITGGVLGNAFDHLYTEEEGPNKWFSNYPFLLVQYLNSSTYPDGVIGNGDPAEVVINPMENFTKSFQFQTAAAVDSEAPFDNYANLIVNVEDADNVLFDGKKITTYTRQPIDGNYEVYLIPQIAAGAHQVSSDSGVGVTIYGYGDSESYAWPGSLGTRVTNDTLDNDTVPPSIVFVNDSLCLHILLSDSASGILVISQDSISNLTLAVDTGFAPGNTSSYADVCVIDPLQSGYMQLYVTDDAGNADVANIIYTHPPIVSPPGFTLTSVSFDTVLYGTEKTLPILTIKDTSSQYPITINNVWTESPQFIINGDSSANKLPITLAPLGSHSFIVTFNPSADSVYACLANAVSNAVEDHPSIERVDTLRGIGYSFPASVADESRTTIYASLTPNPATNFATLNFTLPQTADVTFELSSMDGKTVFRWNADAESEGQHVQTLDISSLAEGDYIYRFETGGESTSGKLAILR